MGRPTLPLLLLILASACGPESRGPVLGSLPDGPAIAAAEEASWRAELEAYRAGKDEEFATSETSPMAGTQYLKSEPAEQVFLIREGEAFALAYEGSEGAVLSLTRQAEGSWGWRALDPGVACRRQGEALASGVPIDAPVLLSLGDLRLRLFPSEDRVTFIVFDRQRPELAAFEHLLYFPPAPELAVHAELVPFEEPDALVLITSRNLKKTFYRYAEIRFSIDGVQQELTALKSALEGEGSEGLFIPFRDATTGKQTYGAGRFLEIEEPAESRFVLDFNRAFNPLCNYSPAYNCAVPPRENRLEVAVRAGEKTYPH